VAETKTPDRKRIKLKDSTSMFRLAWRSFKYYFRNEPLWFTTVVLLLCLSALTPIVLTRIQANIFDEIIQIVTNKGVLTQSLILSIIFLTVMFAVEGIISLFLNISEWYIDVRLKTIIDVDFLEKISSLDISCFDNSETNNLIRKVKTQSIFTFYKFHRTLLYLLREVIGVVLNLSVVVTLSLPLVAIAIVMAIPSAVVKVVFSRKKYSLWESLREEYRDMGWTKMYVTDENTIKEARIYKIIPYLINRFRNKRELALNARTRVYNKEYFFSGVSGVLHNIGLGIITLILVLYTLAKRISIGSLTFYRSAAERLQNSVSGIFRRLTVLYEDSLYVQEYFDFMDLKNEITSGSVVLSPKALPPTIEFHNVSFKYPNTRKYVFKNFNLILEAGEHLALVGENGAGKTTLVKLLARFYDVTKGKILVNGHNIKELDLDSWYSALGTLFQDYTLYHYDAKTNIGIGNIARTKDMKGIVKASKMAESHDFIKDYSKGYDQLMNKYFKGGIDPSTGQKQRIALARAFFEDSPVLILDEPTSAIDPKAEFEIFERLFKFAEGKTVIIVSHRFSTIRNSSRIVVMDKGTIVESGSHKELMKVKDGKYRIAFNLQKKGFE